jgi:hypothetical protein
MGSMIHVEASLVIDARPEELYRVVSDYRVGHPAILPKQYFSALVVEQGGHRAGTIIRGTLTVFGQAYLFRQHVTEPAPGRVLAETDLDINQSTRFTFEPLGGGTRTRVAIASDFPISAGFVGVLERLSRRLVARDIYRKELQLLDDYIHRQRAADYVLT